MEKRMQSSKVSILLIGNFLSSSGKGSRGVCEDLAEHLQKRDRSDLKTSTQIGKFTRLRDIILNTWKWRKQYQVAQVDVFSGPAFFFGRGSVYGAKNG